MYKENMALNNLQWMICHKTKPNHIKPNETKPQYIVPKVLNSARLNVVMRMSSTK